ncbi:ABC transporter ATP-binding protein [Allochromatium tepidum]|uniref:Sugar ABC transporter ATP-binding protein n=1 Tax=Allochromatium tepidum TaxID=553982 RepID=A0ABM7QQL9_9GAMM|nr:ABC transporter ATP-binding protein [Allochromatium tepidum]BCU07998.1 sugar ABC transporter ATP-binding protein [Allochromatium tepidum]
MPEDRHGPALELQGLGKFYSLYARPQDRLRQSLAGGLNTVANRARARLGHPPRPAPCHHQPFWALRGVDLSVARGETLGIVGRNGSGKSTLLQLVAGTLKPSEGHIRTHGRIAALLELGSGFNPEFTGRENVYLNAAILGLQRPQIQARFAEIEAFAGIGEFIDQPVKNYSSGMVVRLAFAVSVCVDPDILIVDEALAVGDAAFQFKCLQRIRELSERGTTLLFVSHDMGMVKTFCHRALYLEQGRVKAIGDPEAIATQYFQDIRTRQRAELAADAPPVTTRPALGAGDKAAAFGDGRAEILSARLSDTGAARGLCEVGGTLELTLDYRRADADAAADGTTPDPDTYLAVVIQNTRLLELCGQRFRLPPGPHGTARVRWTNRLAPGEYFVTLRLERRVGQDVYLPLVAQIAALSFTSTWDERAFLGIMDPDMRLATDAHHCTAGDS